MPPSRREDLADTRAAAAARSRMAKSKPQPNAKPKAKPVQKGPVLRSRTIAENRAGDRNAVAYARSPQGRKRAAAATKKVANQQVASNASEQEIWQAIISGQAEKQQPRRIQGPTSRNRTVAAIAEAQARGGGARDGVAGFLQNLAGDGAGLVRGLPAGAMQAIALSTEAARWPVVATIDEVGQATGLSGENSWIAQRRKAYERDITGYVKGLKDDYVYRYKDLARGDFGAFGEKVHDHPLPYLLDAGAGYSGAGKALTGGAKGARAVGLVSDTGTVGRAGRNSVAEGGARYRPDRVQRVTNNPESPSGEIELRSPRRPYSTNPMTRVVQRRATALRDTVSENVGAAAGRRLQARSARDTGRPIADYVLRKASTQGQFDRAMVKRVRELRGVGQANAEQWLADRTALAQRAIGKLRVDAGAGGLRSGAGRGRGLNAEEMAVSLHAMGLTGKLKASVLKQVLVQRWNRELVLRKADNKRVAETQANIDALQAIPDRLLEGLDADVAGLKGEALASRNRVVAAARQLRESGRQADPDIGDSIGMTEGGMKARRELPSQVLLAGREDAASSARHLKAQARRLFQEANRAEQEGNAGRALRLRAQARRAEAQRRGLLRVSQTAEGQERLVGLMGSRAEAAKRVRLATEQAAARRSDASARVGEARAAVREAPKPSQAGLFQGGRRYELGTGRLRRTEAQAKDRTISGRRVRIVGARSRYDKAQDVTPTGKNPRGTSGSIVTRKDAGRMKGREQQLMGVAERYAFRTRDKRVQALRREVQSALVEQARTAAKPSYALRQAKRELREADARIQRSLRENAGWTPAKNTGDVVSEGIYTPHSPVDKPVPPRGGERGMGTGQSFSMPKVNRSTGYLARSGNMDLDPHLVLDHYRKMSNRAAGPMSPESLNALADMVSFKDADGKPLTGVRAKGIWDSHPQTTVLVDLKKLQAATKNLDELPDGKVLDESLMDDIFLKKPGNVGDDVVVMSRKAADTWTEVMNGKTNVYDKFIDYWRGGLLALSPRWYVNNLVGNAAQYMIMSGGDVRAITALVKVHKHKNRAIREALPPEVTTDTFVNATRIRGGGKFESIVERGYNFNNRVESLWRRGAYFHSMRKHLKADGRSFRGLSGEEIARLIDKAPPAVKRQAMREMELFLGNFRKMTPLERNVLRRIFPFYSWMRVITRLTFTLPFRSPLRAQALAMISNMNQLVNPEDYPGLGKYLRYPSERGAITIPKGVPVVGGARVQTSALNSLASVAPMLETMGGDPSLAGVAAASADWLTPAAQFGVSQAYGVNPFTSGEYTSAPGSGLAPIFGRDSQRFNPATGLPESGRARPPAVESLLQALIPVLMNPTRRALAGGERPFDTTPTFPTGGGPSLFDYRRGAAKKGEVLLSGGSKASVPFGRGNDGKATLGALSSFLGANLREEDAKAYRKRYEKALDDYRKAVEREEKKQRDIQKGRR